MNYRKAIDNNEKTPSPLYDPRMRKSLRNLDTVRKRKRADTDKKPAVKEDLLAQKILLSV